MFIRLMLILIMRFYKFAEFLLSANGKKNRSLLSVHRKKHNWVNDGGVLLTKLYGFSIL